MTTTFKLPAHSNTLSFSEMVNERYAAEKVNPCLVQLFSDLASVQPVTSKLDTNGQFILTTNRKPQQSHVTDFLRYMAAGELIKKAFSHVYASEAVAQVKVDGFTKETIQNLHDVVNKFFAEHVKAWQTQVARIQKLDKAIYLIRETMIPLEKIEQEIASAQRKQSEKDLARAERRKARTEEQLNEIATLTVEKDYENALFAEIRENMVEVRKMEHVIKYIPIPETETSPVLMTCDYGTLMKFTKAVLQTRPHLYDDIVRYVSDIFLL